MRFANQHAFDDFRSALTAEGVNLNNASAITDPSGRVLAHAQTGGMIGRTRYELVGGRRLFRISEAQRSLSAIASGGWWLEDSAFEQSLNFAQTHDISIGVSLRLLCLVPPEWNNATMLIRAHVVRPLLAWRGLANSVITPAKDGGPSVSMPHPNDIASRRVHQLYIPGLADLHPPALVIEQDFPLDEKESKRGFLYV
jgi:hypothetical protein